MNADAKSRTETPLPSGVDWLAVFRLAQAHGVSALLHQTLSSESTETALAGLRQDFFLNAAANLALARELSRILAAFRDCGIRVLPFKGPILAESLYGSLALRASGDLDLLIRRRDLPQAQALLRARGFRQIEDPAGVPPHLFCEHQFVRSADQIAVELRWRITSFQFSGCLDLDYLAPRIRPVKFLNAEAPGLPPEELLLILCIHGSKHRWARLMWICDIALLLRSFQHLDWNRIADDAEFLGVSHSIGCGLLTAHEILGTRIPDEAFSYFCRSFPSRLAAREASRKLFDESLPGCLYQLWLMQRPRDIAGQCFRQIRGKLRSILHLLARHVASPLLQRCRAWRARRPASATGS